MDTYGRQLVAHQQWVESLDDTHPTWSLVSQVATMTDYMPTADMLGSDPYPVYPPGHYSGLNMVQCLRLDSTQA
jgi:hypothetical protein